MLKYEPNKGLKKPQTKELKNSRIPKIDWTKPKNVEMNKLRLNLREIPDGCQMQCASNKKIHDSSLMAFNGIRVS